MLKENLLLDSARPFSNAQNNAIGCPEHSSVGVLFSCQDSASDQCQWYALRVTYSRELKIKALLDEKGIKSFVPMMWRKVTVGTKTEKKLVPAVNNLCFVLWNRKGLDAFIKGYGDNSPVHYYWDRTAHRPLTVPTKAMEDFIKVSSSFDEDLVYLTQISDKLREGQKVRVRTGAFAGVEGRIVRLRKSRRIIVEIPDMMAVASTYIRAEDVEIIN